MVKVAQEKILFARKLRINQTPWEAILWGHLRANKFGIKFKRQVVLGQYIFDFGAKKHKLMIELDGFHHRGEGRINDSEKLNYARKQGYQILKFWNNDIEKNLSKVLDKIYQNLTINF